MSCCDNCIIEKLSVKLCKYILVMSRKYTNAAVKGELGKYLLLITALTNPSQMALNTG